MTPDLPEHGGDLVELSLPEKVESLQWLAGYGKLEILRASRTAIRDVRGLPSSLRSLDISYTEVQRLDGLPPDLTHLDASMSAVRDFQGLPAHLKELAIGGIANEGDGGEPLNLAGLPASLVKLTIYGSRVEDLHELHW